MKLYDSYKLSEEQHKAYYRQYTYDVPLMITLETNEKMKFIQKCMVQCIRHVALNYLKYESIMPLSERTKEILEICSRFPYKPGTYRTDFVITKENEIKLIEITCRFALNGYIRSGFINSWAIEFANENNIPIHSDYPLFFEHLQRYIGDNEQICILKDDRFNEAKYFKTIFSNAGYNVRILSLDEIVREPEVLRNSACITQMRHDELFNLPDESIHAMMEHCLLNDLRTVILPHDKRFFALLYNDAFRTDALGKENAERFKTHLTPTYTPLTHPDLWDSLADDSENHWIVKPTALGMGLGITASPAVSKQKWREALENYNPEEVVFQPYLEQRRFNGTVGIETRTNDYVSGTLLFFEDEFYGPGLFRASSHPVINQGDDRKIATTVLSINQQELDFLPLDKISVL